VSIPPVHNPRREKYSANSPRLSCRFSIRRSGLSPEIRLTVPGDNGTYDAAREFLVDSWEKTLGVEIIAEGISGGAYADRIDEKTPTRKFLLLIARIIRILKSLKKVVE
jgi:hypothetical protein